MQEFFELIKMIYFQGEDTADRTGVGKRSIFGHQIRFDLRKGFPLVWLKATPLRWVFEELMWFLSGSTDVRDLQAKKVPIWDQWQHEDMLGKEMDHLGPIYGYQWRNWDRLKVDQIENLLVSLKNNPYSRRHVVTAWNPTDVEIQLRCCKAPPPCHILFQCYVSPYGDLDLQMYQRSADVFVGVPFNIASYSLLLMMLAQVTGLKPRYFIHTFGDAHLYHNHLDAAAEVMRRWHEEEHKPAPTVKLNPAVTDLFAFTWEDVTLEGYNPHPSIKVDVAV